VVVGCGVDRHHLGDVDAVLAQADCLRWIVRHQTDRHDAQRSDHVGCVAVVTCVGGETEQVVGVDGVRAVLLLEVGTELVHQPDASPLVTGRVDERSASVGDDRPQALAQLHAAVAPQRPERVTGQTLGVDAHQHVVGAVDVAEHEREVHVPRRTLEGVGGEHAVRRGELDGDRVGRGGQVGGRLGERHITPLPRRCAS